MTLQASHLYREIHEQPAVIGRFLKEQAPVIKELAETLRARAVNHAVIAARGTSDNAGRYAKYVWGAHNGMLVMLATPSLYTLYRSPPRFGRALVLGLSQSGKSPDIVAVLAEARKQGALTAAFTNNPESDLAQQADFVVDLMAGPERAVAATKSYTAELAAIALLSAAMADNRHMVAALQQMPAHMAATLSMNKMVAACAAHYQVMQYAAVIGRGFNYATAFETALKMKELSYAIVEPYSSADFMHGPLALLEPGFPVFVLAPSGKVTAEMESFAQTLTSHGADLIVVSDVPALLAQARFPLPLPATVPEWLSPLTAVIPGQLLAMHLAQQRGFSLDTPRGIRKITETR